MFNKKLYLTANMLILPFVIFYKSEYIENLSQIDDMKKYKKELKKYYEEIYRYLNNYNSISDLDEVNLLFDKYYPKKKLNEYRGNISKFYMEVLTDLAKSFIAHRDGKIVFKYWESDCEEDFIGPYRGINKIAFWNYLNRLFTTDLLVIRYLLDNGMNDEINLDGFSSTITLADSQLETILKKGVAETHIHKNAAINFYISWQDLMNFTGKGLSEYLELENSVYYNEVSLQYNIIALAIIRVKMADFLQNRTDQKWDEFFSKCNSSYRSQLKKLCNSIIIGEEIKSDEYNFEFLWNSLIDDVGIVNEYDNKPTTYKDDILKYIFIGYGNSNIILENILLFKAMKYIDSSNDAKFGKLFMNYIRIKNKVLQSKVQSNSLKGLENFKYYFTRSTSKTYQNKNPYEERNYWKILMENQTQNIYLDKLELRASIADGNEAKIIASIKKTMKSFLEAYKELLEDRYEKYGGNWRYPHIALIFHLKKQEDKHVYEKCWVNFENENYEELYFMENRKLYEKQVRALNKVRDNISGMSDFIVGIDAASSENDTEPWVFAPIYDIARDSSCANMFYKNTNYNKRIKTLGFTFHVGEDFRHILTGLRRIDEVIDNLKFHAGDRIGHGIALGVDIDKWINNNRVVILPRIEYLENLLWAWGIYKDGYYSEAFDVFYIEQEIMKLAKKIYYNIDGITVYNLWLVYKSKFKEFIPNKNLIKTSDIIKQEDHKPGIKDLFCREGISERRITWNVETLQHASHCRCYLERMLEPIQVEVNYDKVKFFKQLQKIVCNKISTKAIVVETNPTSNISIGQIESIFEHYIHNLNNRGLANNSKEENSLMVTINSDDPSVFNTNVSNELAYIFYSLQEKGYDRENILQWIDKVRQYGMDSSFIEDNKQSIKEKIDEIDSVIKELEN